MKYDVFISYSSHDQKVVEGLCGYLESRGIRCFVAYRDIPHGVVWASAIVEALDESRMMVVVFSDYFNRSEQVDREIELASLDKKNILTFRISDTAFSGVKRYYLQNIHWIDAFPEPDATFGNLAEAIASLLGVALTTPKGIRGLDNDPVEQVTPIADTSTVVVSGAEEPAATAGWSVGDHYCVDGKEGVVFDVSEDGLHGKIIALKQSNGFLKWASDLAERHRMIGAFNEVDGMANLQAVQVVADWQRKYPAFAWCAEQGEGYYLPALSELSTILLNPNIKNAINQTLKTLGADLVSERHYWSSTECQELLYGEYCAHFIDAYNGFSHHYRKSRTNYVRAVARF